MPDHPLSDLIFGELVRPHYWKNLPSPLFTKEGEIFLPLVKEERRDFIINVFILKTLSVKVYQIGILVLSSVLYT